MSFGESGNAILDRLPAMEREPLLAAAEELFIYSGREIYEHGGAMPYVYFPLRGIVSLVVQMAEGKLVEAATVGSEGLVGVPAFLGLDFSPFSAIGQVPGEALRVPTPLCMRLAASGTVFDDMIRRYSAYLLRQQAQGTACNALHCVEERLCRWLLIAHDCAQRPEFQLTHEFLAEMLAVRRQSVTVSAGVLQQAGLIAYRRGVVRILDRPRLEKASCECYSTNRALYGRIMA
jgi:CRP-like cAMP-binding protein